MSRVKNRDRFAFTESVSAGLYWIGAASETICGGSRVWQVQAGRWRDSTGRRYECDAGFFALVSLTGADSLNEYRMFLGKRGSVEYFPRAFDVEMGVGGSEGKEFWVHDLHFTKVEDA